MPFELRRIQSGFIGAAVLCCLSIGAKSVGAADASKASVADQPEADRPSESSRQRAEARYEQGVVAYREGRYKDAIDAFVEADSLAPSAALSYNTALAYERLLDTAGALHSYRDFLRRSGGSADTTRVKARIAELERRLSTRGVQQVTLFSDPTGATVSVDGRALGVTPWTTELTPGKHTVLLSLKGHDDELSEFVLSPEHAIDVTATLRKSVAPVAAKAPTPKPGAAPATQSAHESLTPWPWVALGVGGAALLTAGGFELSRRAAERDAEHETTQRGYAEKLDTMESRQRSARWLGGTAFVLLATSGVLFVLDSRSRKEAPQASLTVESGGCFLSYRSAF